MDIPANGKSRRQEWTDIGTGMMIMLSIFMLTDGIRKIIHHDDFGWFLAPVWALILSIYLYRSLKH
jgi:hypothetical protein